VIKLTQILHILVRDERQRTRRLSLAQARAIALVHDDAVGREGAEEGDAIAQHRPLGVTLEREPEERVAQREEDHGQVAAEPGELQGLDGAQEAVLERRGRRVRHGVSMNRELWEKCCCLC
jgi:hypothetical protein